MPYTLDYLGLSPDCWLPLIRGRIPQSYAAGQMIYLQDTEAEQFYYLLHGKVKTFISSAGGNERTLTVYGPGSLFGEASFFGRMPRVSSAVALIPPLCPLTGSRPPRPSPGIRSGPWRCFSTWPGQCSFCRAMWTRSPSALRSSAWPPCCLTWTTGAETADCPIPRTIWPPPSASVG